MDRFRCQTPGSNETNLCFNGGTCVTIGDTERCSCPDGWGPDNVLFHQDNCAMPSTALLVAFIFMSIATVICFAALWSVHAKARGRAKTVLIWATITVGLVWAQILSLWLEQGTFISTPILLCIVTIGGALWAGSIAEIVALPIFAIQPRVHAKVQFLIRSMFGFIIAVNTAPNLAMSIASAQNDTIMFNRIALVHIYLLFAAEIAFALLVRVYGDRLITQLLSSDVQVNNRTASYADVAKKIKGLQSGALSLVWGQLPSVVAGAIFLGLGSVPFLWTVNFLLFTSASPSITWTTVNMFRTSALSTSNNQVGASSKSGDAGGSSAMISPQTTTVNNNRTLMSKPSSMVSKESSKEAVTVFMDRIVDDE